MWHTFVNLLCESTDMSIHRLMNVKSIFMHDARAQLGPKMAEVILNLVDEGLDIDKFHIVGHSLGGQMAGIIGRNVMKKSGGVMKLARISGLDPAFPTFYPSIGTSPINKKDAKFVDIIHTDAWLYGAPVSTGTVDFWPNSGRTLQPGCPRRTYKALSDNGKSIAYLSVLQTAFMAVVFHHFLSYPKKKCRFVQSSSFVVVLGG